MSINNGYDQYLRKYRLLITSTKTINVVKSIRTIDTNPAVPPVADMKTYTGKVKATSLKVRAGAGAKFASLGKLKKNKSVKIISKVGTWYRIIYDGGADGTAYVKASYIRYSGKVKIPVTKAEAAAQAAQQQEITDTTVEKRVLEITDLRVTFDCEKATSDTPNYSVITVYNMSQENIAGVKVGDTVILEAGYENGNFGMIFTGQIVQPYIKRENNTDTALVLVVQDGDVYLNSAFVMTTLSSECSQADVVNACITDGSEVTSGLISESLESSRLIRGKVMFGKAADYVRQSANGIEGQFYIEDGKINIVSATDYASNEAVELNPRTGLLDMPGQTDDGVSAKCLINPSIKLNTLVHIDSTLISQKQVSEGSAEIKAISTDGVYKIVKLTYKGDTHGDDWYCEFEAVAQPGLTPSAMNADVTNPWR